MFSLPNDLLSQFSALFTNSSLATLDFIDNRIRHKTEQSQHRTARSCQNSQIPKYQYSWQMNANKIL